MNYTIKNKICQVLIIGGVFLISSYAYAQKDMYNQPFLPLYKNQSVIVCHRPYGDCFNVTVRPTDWKKIVMPSDYAEMKRYVNYMNMENKMKNTSIDSKKTPSFILNGDVWNELKDSTKISIKNSRDYNALLLENFSKVQGTQLEGLWNSLIELNKAQKSDFETLQNKLEDPLENRSVIVSLLKSIMDRMTAIQETLTELYKQAESLIGILQAASKLLFFESPKKKNMEQQDNLKIMRDAAANTIESLANQKRILTDMQKNLYKPSLKP